MSIFTLFSSLNRSLRSRPFILGLALFAIATPAGGEEFPVLPESQSLEFPAVVQADLSLEILEATANLQAVLDKILAEPAMGADSELSAALDRLQSPLQGILTGKSLEITPELLQQSQTLQNAIAQLSSREDINLTPEIWQKLGQVRRLLSSTLSNNELSLSEDIIESSPVLQRWREEIPDVLEEIRHDPAFRTRVRLGYSQFPSTSHKGGFSVGVEDIFLARTGLTVSANYDRVFDGDRETLGIDLNYYLLPLGSYINVAPVLGYRNLTTGPYSTDGVTVGGKIILPLSRTGAADITFSQLFVSPGGRDEVGITTLSAGYAITRHLRLSTDIQKQNSRGEKDSRVGLILEWMP